jgi:hypothetical protein
MKELEMMKTLQANFIQPYEKTASLTPKVMTPFGEKSNHSSFNNIQKQLSTVSSADNSLFKIPPPKIPKYQP